MKTALVIMAAGIGSRFGGGIKQLQPVGPCGEIIMDYSIHDAIEAGFNKVVFIIRKDLEKDFQEVIGNRIEKICAERQVAVSYAYQELDDLPEGFTLPKDRTKPWGTGQAVLACKGIVTEPFVVINADDYYGKEAFVRIHDFLQDYTDERPFDYCMAGFILGNTLSENGGVTRGVCQVDDNGYLADITETHHIVRDGEGAAVQEGDSLRAIDIKSNVSMNMWGLTPQFIDILDEGFRIFLSDVKEGDLKAEYLLPNIIGQLLHDRKITVKVLETQDKWFGVTYKEDKAAVVEAFKRLTEKGIYSPQLF
ncbi:MAG: NDP-sugar synthase [Coprococcus sp.]